MTDNNWLTPPVVVLGTDGSETAKRAAAVAVSVAQRHHAALHLVTVVRPPEGWWGIVGSPPTPEAVADALTRAQREIIDETLAAVDTGDLDVTTVEEIGDPASVLLDYCAEIGAGLLVVGKRGAGLMERLIMGSVADRVVHGSGCPVLVVP
jgi:nucleotide-binding universal stress UspA family protein